MENDPSKESETPPESPAEPTSETSADGASTEGEASEKPAEISELDLDSIPEDSLPKAPRIKDILASPDRPSRMMAWLSLSFGFLSFLCIVLLTYVIITHRGAKKHIEEPTQESMSVDPAIQQELGHYQVVLKAEPNQPHDFNLRVDIVAQCSTQEACDSLKENMVTARDVINPILSSVTRDEFLTLQGKNRIRRRIAEQLSGMVKDGKVDEIQFTDLTIETGR